VFASRYTGADEVEVVCGGGRVVIVITGTPGGGATVAVPAGVPEG
jgi:hypothetical protein